MVRVFSPAIVESDFYLLGETQPTIKAFNGKAGDSIVIGGLQRTFLGIEFEQANSYQILPDRKPRSDKGRQAWQKFKTNVERLAA